MTKTAQNWLDTKYPDKTIGGKIEVYDNMGVIEELIDGELLIDGYVNIEVINLERWDKIKDDELKGEITKVTIKNCPKLKKLKLNNNEISEIIFEGNFPDLVRLDATDNKLTEIDISKLLKLNWLNIPRNPVTKIKGLEYSTKLTTINLDEAPGLDGREYGEWKDAIKGILNISLTDPLPDTWKNDLKDKLDELKNRPTTDNSDQIKNLLGINPADDLPTNWQDQLAKKDDLTVAQNDLKGWKDKFGDKTADQVKKELDDLNAKPAGGTTLTTEQQQKLDDYDRLKAERAKIARWLSRKEGADWEARILQK